MWWLRETQVIVDTLRVRNKVQDDSKLQHYHYCMRLWWLRETQVIVDTLRVRNKVQDDSKLQL